MTEKEKKIAHAELDQHIVVMRVRDSISTCVYKRQWEIEFALAVTTGSDQFIFVSIDT